MDRSGARVRHRDQQRDAARGHGLFPRRPRAHGAFVFRELPGGGAGREPRRAAALAARLGDDPGRDSPGSWPRTGLSARGAIRGSSRRPRSATARCCSTPTGAPPATPTAAGWESSECARRCWSAAPRRSPWCRALRARESPSPSPCCSASRARRRRASRSCSPFRSGSSLAAKQLVDAAARPAARRASRRAGDRHHGLGRRRLRRDRLSARLGAPAVAGAVRLVPPGARRRAAGRLLALSQLRQPSQPRAPIPGASAGRATTRRRRR